jgi:phosphonate transport system substrate-binding protein
VVPVVKGRSFYRSYIVVPKKSPVRSLADLKGRVFAYADPLSLSGYIYPAACIRRLGYCQKEFFSHVFFTESHDKSIEAVATGIADGAAVDSLIFDALRAAHNPNADKLKVIEKSEKFGMPPVVVAPDIDHALRYKLLKVMLNMDKNAAGRKVLKKLSMDRFILPDPALYHSAFLLNKELK